VYRLHVVGEKVLHVILVGDGNTVSVNKSFAQKRGLCLLARSSKNRSSYRGI